MRIELGRSAESRVCGEEQKISRQTTQEARQAPSQAPHGGVHSQA